MTAPITTVSSHNPLTPSDITRLPQGAIATTSQGTAPQVSAPQTLKEDTFGEPKQESHTLRNTIIGLVIAAAAIVGLKHCKFMQVSDAANMKWYDHPKQWVNKLGEWIETPFVWTYKKLFGKEALEKGTKDVPKKPSTPKKTETPKPEAKSGSKKTSSSKKTDGSKKTSAPKGTDTPKPDGSKKTSAPKGTDTPEPEAKSGSKKTSSSKKTDSSKKTSAPEKTDTSPESTEGKK